MGSSGHQPKGDGDAGIWRSITRLNPDGWSSLVLALSQLTRRLGWATPVYHKKEGATPHPGARKNSLQYDGRLDRRFGMRVGTWNLGSLSGKGEACEELGKMIDVGCSQEIRWRTGY